jgi:hypothetical protein
MQHDKFQAQTNRCMKHIDSKTQQTTHLLVASRTSLQLPSMCDGGGPIIFTTQDSNTAMGVGKAAEAAAADAADDDDDVADAADKSGDHTGSEPMFAAAGGV